MSNATRDLPRVIHGSLFLVVLMYLVTNIAYFIVLPKSLIAQSNTVALDFGKAVLGPTGGIVFAVVVAVSCFGALNSKPAAYTSEDLLNFGSKGGLFTSARLICVAGKEGFLPKTFSKLHKTRKTPINAVVSLCSPAQKLKEELRSMFADFTIPSHDDYGSCWQL